ncbi:MAG: heme exporter protein CcmD [Proteobacteria bacterium]|jgi:heme exporter protein CcmD|nr:heme exporter protein CcmD [Pseudomonadota bacterium]
MGEYGVFVWPCYGAVVGIMALLGFISWKNKTDDEKKLSLLESQLKNKQDLS